MVKGDQNIMIILSSPSGVGKTTITKKIQQKYNSFKISVSHTTRSARSNEVEGVDYHFVNEEKFKKLIDDEKFLLTFSSYKFCSNESALFLMFMVSLKITVLELFM